MIIIPILIVFLFNVFVMGITHRKFGEVMPLTMMSCGFIMYAGQYIFLTFNAGMYLIIAGATYGLYFLIKNRKNISSNVTSGVFVFILICIAAAVFDYKRDYAYFDEFWHWGTMVKESLRLDRFYADPASRLVIHKDYPPFLCMIEVLFAKLAGYSEAGTTMSVHIFELSMLLCPAIEMIQPAPVRKKTVPDYIGNAVLFVAFAALIINLCDKPHNASGILPDATLGIVFAYALLLILSGTLWDSVPGMCSFVMAVCTIPMIKQAGIAFSMLLVFAVFCFGIAEKRPWKQLLRIMLIATVCAIGCYMTWKLYVSKCNINDLRQAATGEGQFDLAKIDIGSFLNIISGKSDGLQQDAYRNFLDALCTRNILAGLLPCSSYLLCFAIIYAGILCMQFAKMLDLRQMVAIELINIVGFTGYALMLLVMMLFCFNDIEMQELRSFERYTDSLVVGFVLAYTIYGILLYRGKYQRNRHTKSLIYASLLCLIVLSGTSIWYLMPQIIRPVVYQEYKTIGKQISEEAEDDSTVILVYDASPYEFDGYIQAIVYHYALNCNLPNDMNIYRDDYSDSETREQVLNNIARADYLYVIDTNNAMNIFFEGWTLGEPLQTNTLYKINDGNFEKCG